MRPRTECSPSTVASTGCTRTNSLQRAPRVGVAGMVVTELRSSAKLSQSTRLSKTWGATVRCAYGTPEAGARTAYVPCVGPWSKLPCASGC